MGFYLVYYLVQSFILIQQSLRVSTAEKVQIGSTLGGQQSATIYLQKELAVGMIVVKFFVCAFLLQSNVQ